MLKACIILFVSAFLIGVHCFQRQYQRSNHHQQLDDEPQTTMDTGLPRQTQQTIGQIKRLKPVVSELPVQEKQKCPCPPEVDDDDEDDSFSDFGEATFGMLGSLWAEGLLPTSAVFPNGQYSEHEDEWILSNDSVARQRLQMALKSLKSHPDFFSLDQQHIEISSFLEESMSTRK